jgi:3-oxoacyl-(acyl-carrier-protein) synthase
MNIATDVIADAEAFFEAAYKYFIAHIGEFAVQCVKDAVAAAGITDMTGTEKKTFAFSNIVAAVGRDIVEGSMYMFNFCLEAAVAQQKENETKVNPTVEPTLDSTLDTENAAE